MENRKQYIRGIIIAAVVIILVTLFSIALYSMGIRAENIFMLYTFGVLIIIMETKKYVFGIVSSLVMVATFNYLFTAPRFTFQVNDKNYLISFVIFLVVSMIAASLTIQIQKQMEELEKSKNFTNILFNVSSGYLHVSGLKQVALYGIECLENVRRRDYIIYVNDRKTDARIPYTNRTEEIPEEVKKAANWCFRQSAACGLGTENYSEVSFYMLPIISKGVTYGVLAMEAGKVSFREGELPIIQALTSIVAMAMDRECANEAEQESKIASEREKLRNNLLRSISHDLRTPLAGITGSATFLLESYEQVDRESRETLLRDIANDSVWLGRLVDNLLNMTRIQEGKLKLHYELEVVDDIVSEVSARVQRRLGKRSFRIETPKEYLSVPMDGPLVIQVLVNLLENSIKHTGEDGSIVLKAEKTKVKQRRDRNYARFSVIDDGTGIEGSILEHMFDSFVTSDTERGADCGRGMGLGLSIASEIVKIHKGMIGSYNNEDKGATVYFLLPLEE